MLRWLQQYSITACVSVAYTYTKLRLESSDYYALWNYHMEKKWNSVHMVFCEQENNSL